jgi:hypothetical protein
MTESDIDALQGVADVESRGLTAAINTWDNAVVSAGFKQWTLRHDKLQDLISRAPAAFARHGIRLAPRGTVYTFGPKGRTWVVRAIDGVADKDQLRTEDWARRFFLATLEPEAVVAAARKALDDLGRLEQKVREIGWSPYLQSSRGRKLLVELDTNRPAYVKPVVRRTLDRAKQTPGIDEAQFLSIFVEEIVKEYTRRDNEGAVKARRWTDKIMKAS